YVVVAIHQSAVITRRTLSLHDALPIYDAGSRFGGIRGRGVPPVYPRLFQGPALPCRWGGDHCSASRAGHPAHGRFVEAAPRRRLALSDRLSGHRRSSSPFRLLLLG